LQELYRKRGQEPPFALASVPLPRLKALYESMSK